MNSTAAPSPSPAAVRPSRGRAIVGAVVGGGVGLAVGYASASLIPGLMAIGNFSKLQKLAVLALAVPAGVLGILVHELGHVAGGRLAGFRFLLLLIGPFKLQRTPVGLRFGVNRSARFAGGLACLLPEDDRDLTRRMALLISGGPAASLLLGLGGALAGWGWYGQFSPHAPPGFAEIAAAVGLMIMGALSIGLFAISAFPSSAGGFATDGRRLAMLLDRGPAAEREAALILLSSASLSGVRARDYPAELVARVSEHDDNSTFGLSGKLLGYFHWLDRGDPARAGQLLVTVVDRVADLPRMVQESVWSERAYWLAMHGGDLAAARDALARAGRGDFDLAARLRAEAAVRRAEGDLAGAREKAGEALVALQRRSLSFKPPADAVEWIELLRAPAGP